MHHASRVGEVNFLDLASYTWMITMVTMTLMTLVTLMTLIDDGGLGNLTRNHHQGFRKILSH